MNRDWLDKDFYKVLGVADTASADEIKKAYRKLAQTHHPDANPGDEAAEERFKEISEAYATLSDVEQRKEYDQVRRLAASGGFQGFGAQGGPGFGGFGGQQVRVEDLQDLLGGLGGVGDLFGFGSQRSRGSGPTRGADVATELTIGFEDAAFGATTEVTIEGAAACSRCSGRGAEPGSSIATCPTCGGRGVVAQNQGFFSFSQPCPQCGGSGRLIETKCTRCRGTGTENRRRQVKLRVPAGVKDGTTLRVRGKGGPGSLGGPPGDLMVRIRVAPSRTFGRKGNDLTLKIPITYTEATLGTRIDVPTLNGGVRVKIPSGTPSGKTFRVRGKGISPERGPQGDLLVTVEVAVPKKLSKEEKRLLEELAEHETDDIRSHLR
ncbi:MAG TPA: molecular chaperone DnaJ [Acidimicrobiia bacterium]|nr:molecular chaperone DnaJ [Acidimicrobiia bacterium]